MSTASLADSVRTHFKRSLLIRLGESKSWTGESISTQCLPLDIALGGKGWPKGRIVELYGPESSGKSSLALAAISEVQKTGGKAVYIDMEHSLDPVWASKLGVDVDDLYIAQPDHGEEALELLEFCIKSGEIGIAIIDSVAALVPKAEIEGEITDQHVGLQSRMMSKAMRRLTSSIAKSNACVMFINQVREKIGIRFGNPNTTPGGRALKHHASIRVEVHQVQKVKRSGSDDPVGVKSKATVVKSKTCTPFKTAYLTIDGNGLNKLEPIILSAIDYGIIEKSGAWLKYKGEQYQGSAKMGEAIKDSPEIEELLIQEVKNKMLNIGGKTKKKKKKKVKAKVEKTEVAE